ncbi:hypothetical protein HUJ04_008902 [Dendroctonus ponderosae]|nr:hypothetical protein HUJ04_008902 [Dendroctonus ponderosae]
MATTQRAFTQKLPKHHAADVRRTVSSKSGLISPTTSSSWAQEIVEPLDFEEFVGAYQQVLDRDPLRCILDVPLGDVQVDVIERPLRTLRPILPEEKLDSLSPHVQACVDCYKSVWKVVRYNHRQLSGSSSSRSNLAKSLQPSPKQEFEVDFQVTSETNSELDVASQGSSSRQSIVSIGSLSSCGDTITPRNSWASLDLRHSAGDALIPEILEQSILESQDQVNESQRQIERQEALFALAPHDLQIDVQEPVEKRLVAAAPYEHVGHRVLVKCLQLTMDIEVEPLFASMALYDSKERKKVSETFYFDMNTEGLKRMLGGHVPYADSSTLARSCIFNISHPSPDLFIVVRVEKVLQGDVNECVEPYLKDEKNRDKLKSIAVSVCERLGKYRQAFAWTAINLISVINGGNSLERDFDRESTGSGSNTNSLDRKSSGSGLEQLRRKASDMSTLTRRGSLDRKDKCRSWSPDHLATNLDTFRPITLTMSSFFKQEGDKLRDEDLYKCLQELKRPTLVLKKLKCIPATFKLEISPCPAEYKNSLTTELAKFHPYPDDKSRPTKELLEFPVKEILVPHYTYRNLLFVSPRELNFSNRTGSARNLAVKVQLMAGESETHCLPSIFGKSSCPEMASEVFSSVTYHSKTPVFYDEIKIKLPASLADNHHLLFTFYHISCQKKAEQNVVESPVGYTWLPLLRDGRLVSGEFCLPVMLEPPPRNYSYIPPDVFLPGMKWLDGHKGLFSVILDTASSVHTHDPPIERFFAAYDYIHSGIIPTRLGEVGSEKELTQPSLHNKAVDTIKSLLSWHDSDPRYASPEARHRVAALYFPLLSVAMDVLPLLHMFSQDKNDRFSSEDHAPSNINPSVAMAIAGKLPTSTCDSFQASRKLGVNAEATRNLLTCVLWTLKNVERDSLCQWMSELTATRLATLLHLLDACTSCFEYRPRRRAPPSSGYAHAQVTQDMRSRLEDVILGQGSAREMMQRRKGSSLAAALAGLTAYRLAGGVPQATTEKLRWRKEQMTYKISTECQERPRDDAFFHDTHLDGHFATEASFIVLDTLERSVSTIAQLDSQQHLVGLALAVLLHALGKNQSTTVLPHMFASQRSLVFKFHSALFDEESTHCADLCLLLLKHCGSQIASVRSQAAASLYLLMRQTFQIGNNFARVKMQVTMSLSSLVGTSASFSDESLRRSLKTILEYGERDAELQETTFPEQVRDLVFNLHMILSDTVKMKEFQEDPEMLLDLMFRIAKGYQNSPDLRLTWLANMAQKHMERGIQMPIFFFYVGYQHGNFNFIDGISK